MPKIPSHECLLPPGLVTLTLLKGLRHDPGASSTCEEMGTGQAPLFCIPEIWSNCFISWHRTAQERDRTVAADTITGSEWHLKCKISQMLGTAWNCHHFLSPLGNGILYWVWENLLRVCGEKNPLHHMLLLFFTMSGN